MSESNTSSSTILLGKRARHSANVLAAYFHYTGNKNTVRCASYRENVSHGITSHGKQNRIKHNPLPRAICSALRLQIISHISRGRQLAPYTASLRTHISIAFLHDPAQSSLAELSQTGPSRLRLQTEQQPLPHPHRAPDRSTPNRVTVTVQRAPQPPVWPVPIGRPANSTPPPRAPNSLVLALPPLTYHRYTPIFTKLRRR